MEPNGPDNLRPLFITRNVRDTGYSKIVKEKHLRFVLNHGTETFSGIGFDMASKMELLKAGPVDVVYKIDENDYNGQKSLQLRMVDVRSSESAPS